MQASHHPQASWWRHSQGTDAAAAWAGRRLGCTRAEQGAGDAAEQVQTRHDMAWATLLARLYAHANHVHVARSSAGNLST